MTVALCARACNLLFGACVHMSSWDWASTTSRLPEGPAYHCPAPITQLPPNKIAAPLVTVQRNVPGTPGQQNPRARNPPFHHGAVSAYDTHHSYQPLSG